jgi:hypothetical protein
MRFFMFVFIALGFGTAPAAAQTGKAIVGGIIGSVVGEIIQQGINEAGKGGSATGGSEQESPRSRRRQLTDEERQERAEQEKLRKAFGQDRRQCLDKSDLDACQRALASTVEASTKERNALLKKTKALEQTAMEVQRQAQEQEAEAQRQAAAAQQQQAAPPEAAGSQASNSPVADAASDVRVVGQWPASDVTGPIAIGVRDRMKLEIEHLSAQGFRPTPVEVIREIAKNDPTTIKVGLNEGIEYAFIAACAECSKVELILRNGEQIELARSPEAADTVILNGSPPATGDYEIVVGTPGCSSEKCFGGLIILRKGGSS